MAFLARKNRENIKTCLVISLVWPVMFMVMAFVYISDVFMRVEDK